jgi:hypothetical protein
MAGRYGDSMDDSIRSMMHEMDSIASRLHLVEKEAYLEACRQNPDYGDRLKKRFLRVENYNAGLAVHRMCQYFDFKLHWFGQEALGRPIELFDLRPLDLEILRRGDLHMLKHCCDTEGRKIAYYDYRRRHSSSNRDTNNGSSITSDTIHFEAVSTMIHSSASFSFAFASPCLLILSFCAPRPHQSRRATFFFFEVVASDDEEAQTNGITSVICTDWNKREETPHFPSSTTSPPGRAGAIDLREHPLNHLEAVFEIGRFLLFAAPLRIAKLHFVYNPESMMLTDIAQWLKSMVSPLQGRVSFCSHQIRMYSPFLFCTSGFFLCLGFRTFLEISHALHFLSSLLAPALLLPNQ